MADRGRAKRERDVRARHPKLGGVILALQRDPQQITAWEVGAEGERRVGRMLDLLAPQGVITLHDRAFPRSKGNIDHIAVASTGVYVIDTKHYVNKRVERRDVGGFLRTEMRLYVDGRDRTSLVGGVNRQALRIEEALVGFGGNAPVHAVLCFDCSDWGMTMRPPMIGRVLVAWPKALKKRLLAEGLLDSKMRANIAEYLAHCIRPAG